ADAMRFVLAQLATNTQDVRLGVDMVCPHTGAVFEPKWTTTPSGHRVAEPIQVSPRDPSRRMVSGYGAATGAVRPTEEMPLARNTSSRFDLGRNFCNKLWNATRFALGNLRDGAPTQGEDPTSWKPQTLADRWIVTRLHRTVHAI